MRFGRAFLLTLLSREATLAFGFINAIVLSRVLGPAGIGAYSLVVTAAHFLGQTFSLGMNHSQSLVAARRPGDAGYLFTLALIPSVAWGLLGGATLFFFPNVLQVLLGDTPAELRFHLWAGTLLIVVHVNLAAILFGLQRFTSYGIATSTAATGIAASNLALLPFLGLSTTVAMNVWLVWNGLASVLTLLLLVRVAPPRWAIVPALLGESLTLGSRALLNAFLSYLAYRGTLVLLNRFHARETVGYFAVALPLAEILVHVPATLGSILCTRAATRQQTGELLLILRSHLWLSATLALMLWVTAPWIIQSLFGARYGPSVDPFRILVVGNYFLGIWILISGFLTGRHGYPWSLIGVSALMSAACLGFGYLWIPEGGTAGGAWSWSVAAVLGAGLGLVGLVREIPGGVRMADLVPRREDLRAMWSALLSRSRARSEDART